MEKSVEAELVRFGIKVEVIMKMLLQSSSLLITRQSSISNLNIRKNMQLDVIQMMDQPLEVILLFKINATLTKITTPNLEMITPYQQVCHKTQLNQNVTLQEVRTSKSKKLKFSR
jgi:hypothetical protein